MIHFISAPSSNPSVENVMEYVNNFVNLNDLKNEEGSNTCAFYDDFSQLMELTMLINQNYAISAERSSLFLAQGRLAKVKIFIKKMIRNFMGWYLRDITIQQTEFNANLTRIINQQMVILNHMNTEITQLREDSKRLKNN